MDVLKIREAGISHQMEAYRFTGNDGWPTAEVFSPIYAIAEDGREFYLPMGKRTTDGDGFTCYVPRYNAEKLLPKVISAGVIQTIYWIEIEPINLEEEWGPDMAMRERQDEMAGLYH